MPRIREPDWHQHRMFNTRDIHVNVHVFGPDSAKIERLLRFRDRLRRDAADRGCYATAKREPRGAGVTSGLCRQWI